MLRRNRNTPQSPGPTPISLLSTTGFAQHQTSSDIGRYRTFLSLPKASEFLISVDHHQIWRRHLAWCDRDGDKLRQAVTSRFASNMVFMSLLLSTEIAVLFSPSKPAQSIRQALDSLQYPSAYFWGGLFLCISIGLTLSTLLANFTSWAIIGAISAENAHAVLRSSIGLYAAQLPARMAVFSIYCFVIWVVLLLFEILPHGWNILVAVFIGLLFIHIVVFYSAFGRLVMYSKAMRTSQIFRGDEEDSMTPDRLSEELLKKAIEEREENTPLPLYYRQNSDIRRQVKKLVNNREYNDSGIGEEDFSDHLKNVMHTSSARRDYGPLRSIGGSETNGELERSIESIGLYRSDNAVTCGLQHSIETPRFDESKNAVTFGSVHDIDGQVSSPVPKTDHEDGSVHAK